ncbi:TraR/DksA family transcriptional regulator [Bacillus carboniphilus]|uniref:TraR/DksA family transcriptional regulator n=1 Tax=Bacillus carboniphilus TaxID=86663 RepID=A0ABY9JYJ6_9BACI|nr:TraR/DksA family transcriptional regulator [Bacillus carboniphilus]WLR43607.1 TraR/DksA family transcriptional regulator [Bacillus carboniphilus]
MVVSVEQIQFELLKTKEELEKWLLYHPTRQENNYDEIVYFIKAELEDVNRALKKIELGSYGICEETSHFIPIESMNSCPTARTVNDVSFSQFYSKKLI